MAAVASDLHECYKLMESQPLFMSSMSVAALERTCMRFGRNFMICRDHCRQANVLAWEVTPKVHKMQHLPRLAEVFNPVRISCYIDESLASSSGAEKRACKAGARSVASPGRRVSGKKWALQGRPSVPRGALEPWRPRPPPPPPPPPPRTFRGPIGSSTERSSGC
eukprot:1169210-Pyramimonas_sp.AAC.1